MERLKQMTDYPLILVNHATCGVGLSVDQSLSRLMIKLLR